MTAARHPAFHRLRVEAIEPLTKDSVAITFAVPPLLREEFRFTQGQHVSIRTELAGDDVRRSYSICTPATGQVLRVGVKRIPGGAFSDRALTALRDGDELDVMTPAGRFFTPLDPAQAKHYVCVAAGSGITPILSIAATALAVEPGSRVTLLYANRSHDSVMFLEEVEDLKDRYTDRFHLVHVLSREQQSVELFSGRLDGGRLGRILDQVVPPTTVDEWFLCGPVQMVTDLRATLFERDVPPEHVHLEVFHAEPTAAAGARRRTDVDPGPGADVTVTLDGRSSSFRLPAAGPPVLDALLAVRTDAPYACKGGVCGTCRARVVEGTVEMETNWALEPDEVARGYVLTCQSHPSSARLVLDYDS